MSALEHETNTAAWTPQNLEAEMALLGAILSDNDKYAEVAETVRADDFADPVNGTIFAACGELILNGNPASPITLKSYFGNSGILEDVGGPKYLARLAASVPFLSMPHGYASAIVEESHRRALIQIGQELVDRVGDAEPHSAQDDINWAEEVLYRLGRPSSRKRDIEDLSVHLDTALREVEETYNAGGLVHGLKTGFIDLDRRLKVGMRRGDLVILAGRPSMGKTSLATDIAVNVARAGKNVSLISLEMPGSDIARRIMSERVGTSASVFDMGDGSAELFQEFFRASQELRGLPLIIDEQATLSTTELRARARRMQRGRGLDLLIVDYLQLMQPPERRRRYSNRVDEVTEISRDLKALAMEMGIPVLALSQLNRAVESRDDKRPVLRDLRESGSIEQDADQVWFLYRAEYYLANTEPKAEQFNDDEAFNKATTSWQRKMGAARNKASVIIAKSRRGGGLGSVDLHFNSDLPKFSDLRKD